MSDFVKTLNLLPDEEEMLLLKYQGTPFGQMSPAELLMQAQAIMLRIHAITGWLLPEKEIGSILEDQLVKTLRESYSKANTSEIEAAFRLNGTLVSTWGRSFNLGAFNEVLQPYFKKRHWLSEIEAQARAKKQQVAHLLPDAPMTDQETIDFYYEVWQAMPRLEYIQELVYDILDHYQVLQLSTPQKKQLMVAAGSIITGKEAEDPGFIPKGVDREAVQKRYAKKMAVANLFATYQKADKKIVLP